MLTVIPKYEVLNSHCRIARTRENDNWTYVLKLAIRLSRLGFKVWCGEMAHSSPHVPKAAVSYLGRGPVQDGGPADYTRLDNTSGHGEMMRLLNANQTMPRH